jgi:type VI secretion system protein ImpG
MRDDLLYYYERELAFIRRTGAEFAKRYPKVASRLELETTKCDDPHVERLLEGFSFLAARVQLRIDDDFSEFGEALLGMTYPHYTRPTPSMSIVEFGLDPEQGKLSTGLKVPRGSTLLARPSGGTRCQFMTCYDTTLWPVTVAAARWVAPHELQPPVRATDAVAALRIELNCLPDITFGEIQLDRFRFYINAEANLASTLYELLLNNCTRILLRDPADPKREPIVLPASAISPVGFDLDQGMLPTPRRSFLGYQLLQEYFTFPEKFYFLDLSGFDRARAAGFGNRLEAVFLISSFERSDRRPVLEAGITKDVIRPACSPIINLFPKTSEPVPLTQRHHEYMIVPDARRRTTMGIFSIEEVTGVSPGSPEPLRYEPLYSFRHGGESAQKLFWLAKRRPTQWRPDEGTDVWISFVDRTGRVAYPDLDAVTTRLLCYNGALPARLPFGDPAGDFELPGGGPITRIATLVKPTLPLDPPLGKAQLWRLISQLSLNYVSLVEGGVDALRELLQLHNFPDSPSGDKQVRGVVGLKPGPAYTRIESEHGLTFARGHRVEIEFDEEHFTGGGVYLMAAVLERFLGLYVSLNSFTILAARTRQRKELLREWPPRSGAKALL